MKNLLFLPGCLRKDYAEKVKEFVKDKNYDVYVLLGGSMIKKILAKYDLNSIDKLVGVACKEEVSLALDYFKKLNILDKVIPITLTKDGCENTECDLEDLFAQIDF